MKWAKEAFWWCWRAYWAVAGAFIGVVVWGHLADKLGLLK